MRAYYHDVFVLPLPAEHRFPMGKYRLLRDRLGTELPGLCLSLAPAASEGELALAHAPTYIRAVLDGTLGPAEQREIGFPWSPALITRSVHSVGATIAAARCALEEGLAGSLGGGTHHAGPARGGGFCVFNDIAVAARLMQAEWRRQHREPLQVAVVDLDVHQGNGTAEIFRGDDSVFTLSMHGARNFPFRKVESDLDVELPDGCDDAGYLAALDEAQAVLWRRLSDRPPGLVFYQAGVDIHANDRLGRLAVSADGVRERDRRVITAVRGRGIPLVLTMGGGYGRDLDTTVDLQVTTWREALAAWSPSPAGSPGPQ